MHITSTEQDLRSFDLPKTLSIHASQQKMMRLLYLTCHALLSRVMIFFLLRFFFGYSLLGICLWVRSYFKSRVRRMMMRNISKRSQLCWEWGVKTKPSKQCCFVWGIRQWVYKICLKPQNPRTSGNAGWVTVHFWKRTECKHQSCDVMTDESSV